MEIPCKLAIVGILVCEAPWRRDSHIQEPSLITGSKMMANIRDVVATMFPFGPELTHSRSTK